MRGEQVNSCSSLASFPSDTKVWIRDEEFKPASPSV
ncbi:uncharacterized protein J3R85_018483 [Psidium guajava]|nr:uncharacterized protein J3R85_018483 [Psidium guajava]